VPQLMPPGAEVTVPVPLPFLVTSSWYVASVKVAVTFLAWVIETSQVAAVPVQAPDQFVNVDPVAAVADRVTLALAASNAEQVVPQAISLEPTVATAPLPVPALVTVRA
jgi:hypothetical protein